MPRPDPMKAVGDRGQARDRLFDALFADLDRVSELVRAAMREALAPYRSLPMDALGDEVRHEVQRVLQSARAGRAAIAQSELDALAAIGESRAMQGVPIEEMLRAWRIGVEVVIAHARALAADVDVVDGELLDFVQDILAWADAAMLTTAAAHRQADLELARQEQQQRDTFVRALLFGAHAPSELSARAGAYGIDPSATYIAVRARAGSTEESRRLEHALGWHRGVRRAGLGIALDGDLAGFVSELPAEVDGAVVGVGPPRTLDRLPESFRLASRALETADAFGLAGVHDLQAVALRAAVTADRDVGDTLIERYIAPLADLGSREELIASMRTYFACGMHVERAAERLFVHQNTLRYRIGRFEQLAGCSLRDPHIAFEVWWALERSSMRPSTAGAVLEPPTNGAA